MYESLFRESSIHRLHGARALDMVGSIGSCRWKGCAIARNHTICKARMPILTRSTSFLPGAGYYTTRHTFRHVQLEMANMALAFFSIVRPRSGSVRHLMSGYCNAQVLASGRF